MKREILRSFATALLLVFILMSFLFVRVPEAKGEEGTTTRLVQIQCLRSDSQEEHVFLNPEESITFNASEKSDGLNFESINVELNATDQAFLTELTTDLYISSYDYFGNLGAWTSNTNFTITNPTASTQELFLKITRNYLQTTYAVDNVVGNLHTIDFTSGPAANRVFVRWGVFASLKYLEANQSEVDVSSLNRTLHPIMVEFLPTYISFHLFPPERIQGTHFLLKLEESDFPPPSGYCYISAFLIDDKEITLGPLQEYLFEIPKVNGWNFMTAAAYTNLTGSLYPQPYPFQLVNLAVWEPDVNPMLVTAVDTSFGVKNLTNETFSLSFEILYYYWQNQTDFTFSHELVGSDAASITHKVLVNVTNADVGAEAGLIGQYLRFQVPGKTVSYQAPDPVGKYEQTYIPLKLGSYVLVTRENRIVVNMTSGVADLGLSNTLRFNVTYNGEPLGGAAITIRQSGTFTSRTYTISTNQNGEATVTVYSHGPELDQLSIEVSKDEYNYVEQTISYFVGASWIVIIALVAVVIVVLMALLIRMRRKQKSCT